MWFLKTRMNIPADRMYAANWVLQCSISSFMFNLVSVPYNALIVAHESIKVFAYIGLDVLLRLAVVLSLAYMFDGGGEVDNIFTDVSLCWHFLAGCLCRLL